MPSPNPLPDRSTPDRPELQRFLARLPPSMVSRLSDEELSAYAKALTPHRSPHWLDLKASLPLPGFGVYVALLVGRERRNAERLRREGQRRLTPNLVVAGVLVTTVLAGSAMAMILLATLKHLADRGGDLWWHAYAAPL